GPVTGGTPRLRGVRRHGGRRQHGGPRSRRDPRSGDRERGAGDGRAPERGARRHDGRDPAGGRHARPRAAELMGGTMTTESDDRARIASTRNLPRYFAETRPVSL